MTSFDNASHLSFFRDIPGEPARRGLWQETPPAGKRFFSLYWFQGLSPSISRGEPYGCKPCENRLLPDGFHRGYIPAMAESVCLL